MSQRVAAAVSALSRAKRELEAALKTDYPPEKFIKWKWAGRECMGHVVRNGYGERVYVRNDVTGKSRWIRAYNIVS